MADKRADYAGLYDQYFDFVGDESAEHWRAVHCPFHEDATPSAGYNTASGVFNCYKCGSFAPAQFLVKLLNIPITEAHEKIDDYRRDSGLVQRQETFTRRLLASPRFQELYKESQALVTPDIPIVRHYMEAKGLTWETLRYGHVGFLPGSVTSWSRDSLVFPYLHNGEAFGIRYRDAEGNKSGEPNCHFGLYGADELDDANNISLIAEGECTSWDTLLEMPDGTLVQAGDLIGRKFQVVSFDPQTLERRLCQAKAGFNGSRAIIRITTNSGRILKRTENHLLLMKDHQWKRCDTLQVGDYFISATTSPIEGWEEANENELKLIAYLIGDGSVGGGSRVIFAASQKYPQIIEEYKTIVQTLGGKVSGPYEKSPYNYPTSGVLEVVRRWGIYGHKFDTKRFPSQVWRLNNKQLALFLSRLYATDGCAGVSCGRLAIEFDAANEELCRDVQRALRRLGIRSRISRYRSKWPARDGSGPRFGVAWRCRIGAAQDALRFSELVGIFGKEKAVQLVVEQAKTRTHRLDSRRYSEGDIYGYERVVKVEHLEPERTVGIIVEGAHTYITPDACEHNTDRLRLWQALGGQYVVVGTPTAAFAKEWAREFEGIRTTILVPQDDEATEKMLDAYRRHMPQGIIQRLHWKRKQHGKDVTEWLRYHEDDELLDIIEALVEPTTRRILDWGEFVEASKEPRKWLIQGLLARRWVGMLAGAPKSYKTWMALNIIRCLLFNEELCGIPGLKPPPDNPIPHILILEEEGDIEGLFERIQMVLAGDPRLSHTFWGHHLGVRLDSDAWIQQLSEEIDHKKIDLLIIDPFHRTYSVDEDRASEMGLVWNRIAQLTTRFKHLSILILHHFNKCLDENSLVELASGSIVRAKDLSGTSFRIASFNPKTLERSISLAYAEPNGSQECVRLTLESGRTLVRTTNHPLLVPEEVRPHYKARLTHKSGWLWEGAGQLEVGDYILTTIGSTIEGFCPIDENKLKLLGYLIGDGCTTRPHRVSFANDNAKILEEMSQIVQALGGSLTRESRCNYNLKGPNIREIVNQYGLRGLNAFHKRIPERLWSTPNAQLALFLNRLYATDGCASGGYLIYCTVSKGLCDDVQRALWRLGIYSTCKKRATSYKQPDGTYFRGFVWECLVSRGAEVLKFINTIGIYGKEEAVEKTREIASSRRNRGRRGVEPNLPEGYTWERVRKVEKAGRIPTIAITVPGNDTFITPEACEHNSGSIEEGWNAFRGSGRSAAEVDLGIFMEARPKREGGGARVKFDGRFAPILTPDGKDIFKLDFQNGLMTYVEGSKSGAVSVKGSKPSETDVLIEEVLKRGGTWLVNEASRHFHVSITTIRNRVTKSEGSLGLENTPLGWRINHKD